MRSLRASGIPVIAAVGATVGIAVTAAAPAWSQECPGNPDALGTSRVLALEPGQLTRVGIMQYPKTLPLADKEVVLTFDDGPLPRYSNPVLDILAGQCVKATYFLIGSMARAYPAVVRRMYDAGHTIGTHTEDHPSRMHKLPIEKVRWEIDQGIADVAAALGDPKDLAPFFRIPGLARSDAIEQELAARSLVVFSSDTVADDWHRRIKPADIVRRAMSRLEARGKGILLLHDIHPATVAALPELLKKLREAGFHVVHVIPGAGDRIEVAGEPAAVDQDDPAWPKPVAPPTDNRAELSAPDKNTFAADYRPWHAVVLADGSTSAGYLALAAITQWAEPQTTSASSSEPELAAPSIPEYLDAGLFHDSARADKPPASGPAVSDSETPTAGSEPPASGPAVSDSEAPTARSEPPPAPAPN